MPQCEKHVQESVSRVHGEVCVFPAVERTSAAPVAAPPRAEGHRRIGLFDGEARNDVPIEDIAERVRPPIPMKRWCQSAGTAGRPDDRTFVR